jgi:hypothetical protein
MHVYVYVCTHTKKYLYEMHAYLHVSYVGEEACQRVRVSEHGHSQRSQGAIGEPSLPLTLL